MALSKKKKKLLNGILIGILSGIFIALGTKYILPDFFNGLEKVTYDYRYMFKYILGNKQLGDETGKLIESMTIVDIDERAMAKLGNYNKWPRSHHGSVVEELSNGGASSVIFDIMFKTADYGEARTNEVMEILQNSNSEMDWDGLRPSIQMGLNHDSMLVHSLRNSDVVIGAGFMNLSNAYLNPSDWMHLATEEWHQQLNPHSAADLAPEVQKYFRTMPILDNVFKEFGQASTRLGLVNVVPDADGVHRRMPLLYNFPDTAISKSEKSHTYPVISLQACLFLMGKTLKDAEIVPGEYINLGAPFRIYRQKGQLKTSYPNLTLPMVEQIIAKKDKIQELGPENTQEIMVSSPIILRKDEDEILELEVSGGNIFVEELFMPLLENQPSLEGAKDATEDEPFMFTETASIRLVDGESNIFLVYDSETEEEAEIDSTTLALLYKYWDPSIAEELEPGKNKILSGYLGIRWDNSRNDYASQIMILTKDVVGAIASADMETITGLEEGKQLRFGNDIQIPIDEQGRMLLNYQGKGGKGHTFRYISYYDVIAKRHDPTFYQGKTFLLGSSAAALFDIVASTFDETYPGVEIHATAIHNILTNNFMHVMKPGALLIILVVMGLIVGLITYFVPLIWAVLTVGAISIGYAAVAFYYFDQNLWVEIARPEITIFLTFLFVLMSRYIFEERDKKFLNDAFKNYISPELIDQMVESGNKPSLGGTEATLSAYFTDIQGFSTFSEKLGSPTKLVELLNEYLSEMTDILMENQGTLDKYEGDAIIAFFGAPVKLEEHALYACRAAMMMQRRLGDLRKKWQGEGDKWPKIVHEMRMRIGVNTGPIVTGNMGSRVRMNYTMMGDAVNLAARLESAAKQYGVYTMVSHETLEGTKGALLSRELDLVRVVGKSEPVRIYELMEMMDDATDQQKECAKLFHQGLEFYRSQKWDEAIEMFKQSLELEPYHPDTSPGCKTTPSQVFIDRCIAFKTDRRLRLPDDWDGVYTATEK